MPFGLANLLLGALASAVVLATASPTLAGQYGQIISAAVVLTLLVFALAAAAVVRTMRGGRRLIGFAALIFSLGLIAVQPRETLLLGITAAVGITLAVLLLRALRRPS
jgi:hypothetical protein